MVVEGAVEPRGGAPGASAGAGSPGDSDCSPSTKPTTERQGPTQTSARPQTRHHTDVTAETCTQSNAWKNQPTDVCFLCSFFISDLGVFFPEV